MTLRWITIAFVGSLAGCTKPVADYPTVGGTVLFRGQPAVGAVITLHAADAPPGAHAERPTGVVAADGTFELRTGTRRGAPPGEYRVTVVWERPPANKPDARREDYEDPLRGRFSRPQESGLKATVAPTGGRLAPIELN